MKALVIALLWGSCLSGVCRAESALAAGAASAHLTFRIVVPPVFRVLQATPVADGMEYRVWTNMRSVFLQGRLHQFRSVGETVIRSSAAKDLLIVHGL